jgi:RND family efflux transporter MFP subunit
VNRSHIIIALLVTLTGCGQASKSSDSEKSESRSDEAVVTVAAKPAVVHNIGRLLPVLGRFAPLLEKRALITSVIEGQVVELRAKAGEKVAPGQILVQLDTRLAESDLAEKQAARDSADASLQLLKAPPRSEDKHVAELAVEQAKIAVERAEAQLERLKELRKRNEVPEAQSFEAEEAVKQARVQQETAQAQLDVLVLPPRKEAVAEAESKVTIAEKVVQSAKARISYYSIKAPISGILSSLTCHPGQTISVGSNVGEVIDTEQLEILAWAPVEKSQLIQVGQVAYLGPNGKLVDKDDNSNNVVVAHVSFVGSSTDLQTGNVPLRIIVDNKAAKFVVGQTINADIEVIAPTATVCVPHEAIHDEGDSAAITVVREGKASVLHPQIGESENGWTAVSGIDLQKGELVAISGAYNLPDGAAVKVADGNEPSEAEQKSVTK